MPDRREHAFNGSSFVNGPSDQRESRRTSAAFRDPDQAFDGLVVFRRVFLANAAIAVSAVARSGASQISRRSLCALG